MWVYPVIMCYTVLLYVFLLGHTQISELWPLSLSLCQPTLIAILETKCDLEKVWKYHHHLYQIDPIKCWSTQMIFWGVAGLVCDLCMHTHTLTLLFHCRLQAARQGVSIHTQSTQRTLTGILRCTRRPAQERWKVCSDRPPIPSPHPPPLLCSRMLSGECVPVISIFTNIIAWIGWIIPDIQEWSGTLPTIAWIGWTIPDIQEWSGTLPTIAWIGWTIPDIQEWSGCYSRHLGRHGRQLPYM